MKKLLLAVSLLSGLAGPGWAQTVEQQVLSALAAQGYVIIEKGYTFLGRLRIVAENDEIHREIVVNPGTGEILRDYAVMLPGRSAPPSTGKLASPGTGHVTSATVAAPGGSDDTARTTGVAGAASVTTGPEEDDTATDATEPPDAGGSQDGTDIGTDIGTDTGTDTGPIELVLPESILQMDPEAP